MTEPPSEVRKEPENEAGTAALPESHPTEVECLFERYARTRETALRDRLVLVHLGLVRYLAGKFANRGEPLEDLVQVGTIGLINAVDRFDPSRGTRFSTYAAPTIVGEIKRHFRDKAWNLKVPRRLQELNQSTARAADSLTQTLQRSPTISEIAGYLNASEEDTLAAIELGNAYETVSLDSRVEGQADSTALTLAEFIGGEDDALLHLETFQDLREAVRSLDDREQTIIALRFFSDLSQTEVAHRLQISQMHVSRLQQKALRKLKSLLAR